MNLRNRLVLNYSTPNTFVLILFFTIGFYSYGQGSFVDKIYPLQQNPILKEKVYIHTNKTSYFIDDTIWFKAYVGDTLNCPSTETSKLYVNLLDSSGTLIFEKNIFVDNGTGKGQFELNAAVSPGKYYIQSYTNYMRNFGNEYHYQQEITVLGNSVEEEGAQGITYDVQFLPEGGHLLESIENVIGIKALVNGKGMDFSGTILNSKGDSIAGFDNEHLGMGRCKFVYEAGERYKGHITINDTLIKIDVPQALKKGLVLHTDNSEEDYLKVILKTNETTFYDQVYSNYTLMLHQGHQIYGMVSVARLDSTVATIKTDKNVFLDGVHTVTLFEDDRPIAERKFFMEKDYKRIITNLDKVATENDSIRYKLRLSLRNLPIEANLSISVLSENTKAYTEKQNLRSAFLLTSLIKGNVENPAYYFDLKNPKRKEHLDLLLLTQGWSQYSLKEMIRELNPRPRYKFEYGIDIAGVLEGPVLHNRLALIANDFQVIDKANVKEDRKFQFNKLLLFKGDTIKVSYLNWRGKIIRPDSLRFDGNEKQNVPIPRWMAQDIPPEPESTEEATAQEQNKAPLRAERGTIALDEVTLTDKKLSKRIIERRKTIEKYRPIVLDIGKYYDLPVPENFKDADLMSFLKIKEGVSMKNTNGGINYLQVSTGRKAFLFIDGKYVESPELPAVKLSMAHIENVMVGVKSIPFTVKSGTFIQVFTTDNYKDNTVALFNEHIVEDGYDMAKEYYTPLYDFDTIQFSDWTEIDWKPTVRTDKKGVVFIKVPKIGNQQKYLFCIQGFSEKGHLISELLND